MMRLFLGFSGLQGSLVIGAALVVLHARPATAVCVGDCDGINGVTINEVVTAVNIVLGNAPPATCPNADANGDGSVTVDDVIAAINSFLSDVESCPLVSGPSPTVAAATDTPEPSATPTPTDTASPTRTHTSAPPSTATATRTSTSTPTPLGNCGNGFLDKGDTCTSCPVDCTVRPCTATTTIRVMTVNFAPPSGQDATSVTVLLGYRSEHVSLPGSGSAVGSRVKNRPSNVIAGINDLDYALRVVLTRSSPLPAGRLFTVDFDSCQGAAAPTAADFGCTLEGCASSFGTIDGCTCTVTVP